MTARAITVVRWSIVVFYALIAWGITHDGVTAGELVTLAVIAAILVVIILAADWIANGKHQEGDPWDGEW